jgi:hypothetical protein
VAPPKGRNGAILRIRRPPEKRQVGAKAVIRPQAWVCRVWNQSCRPSTPARWVIVNLPDIEVYVKRTANRLMVRSMIEWLTVAHLRLPAVNSVRIAGLRACVEQFRAAGWTASHFCLVASTAALLSEAMTDHLHSRLSSARSTIRAAIVLDETRMVAKKLRRVHTPKEAVMTALPGWSAANTLYRSKAVYRGANLASQGGGASAATRSAVTPQQLSCRNYCLFHICYNPRYSEWDCWRCLRHCH